jgi:bis(5'-nucleosyl)-tetraphosphatase (symmetrical)
MADWVIGDIHGCWRTLERLLDRIGWDPSADRVWLIGDLVNKGTGSLAVLRWAADPANRVEAVLGNHDLHLLARATGVADHRTEDTFDDVLEADDHEQLLTWLRGRPLLVEHDDTVLVHAGLHPSWNLTDAVELAAEVRAVLGMPDGLRALYARRKTPWSDGLDGIDRAAAGLAIFTRVRVLEPDGTPVWEFTGPPEEAPADTVAWWECSRAVVRGRTVVFGHWARLGLVVVDGVRCLDGACVYGGDLAALRLEDGELVTQAVVMDDLPA